VDPSGEHAAKVDSPPRQESAVMKKACWIVFFLLVLSAASFAQGMGDIVGTVTDPSGAVLAGAKVTAIETGTGILRTTTTDAQGYYVLPSVKPASYTVSIESPGFRTEKQVVQVLADQSLTVNSHLQLGAPTEVVEVTGTDLQVDTTTSTVKQVIEEKRISELPLNGRNAATLALLVPGVVNSPNGGADQGATKTFPGGVTFASNGTRQNTISYQLDGGNYVDEYTNVNQPFPFPDALQEFSVQTANYSAEYGQNAGAVVNVITKSGTNNFHGNVFEFVRNPVFNAQNFFATPTTPDRVKRNQYGGTVGGPVLHDKMYFFAGYQRTAFRNLALGSAKVVGQTDLTSFLAKGPFGTPGSIDPAIAKMIGVVPGCNVIGCGPTFNAAAGQADPNAKFALAGPIPTGSNPTQSFSKPDTENFDSGMGKLDYVLSQKDKLTLRYEYDRFTKAPVFNPKFLVQYTDATHAITAQNALIHETHTFSPTLLNDARISYSREIASRGPASTAVDATGFGTALPFEPTPSAVQGIGVQGGFSFGDNPTGLFIRQNFGFANDVSWVLGKHDVRFGGSIERSHVDLVNQFNQPGLFGFGTSDNYLFGGTSFSTYSLFLAGILSDGSGTGNGFAFQQGAGEFKQNRNIFAGVYVQDNYKISRRLTLNLGLRYEPVLPWSDKGNRWAQVNFAAMAVNVTSKVYPNAPPGILFSGQNGIPSDAGMPDNALRASLTNFEPRIGFAYDLTGDGKTSIRGGAGLFYDSRVMGMLSNRYVDEWPFSPQFILSSSSNSAPTASSSPGSFSDPLCTQAATQAALKCNGGQAASYPKFPSPFPAPTNFAYVPPFNEIAVTYDPTGNYRVPAVYAWNMTVEHELPANSLVRGAYVGSLSRHILETQFLNAAPCCTTNGKPGTGFANALVAQASGGKFKTNTFSNTVQADINDINSNYNSLQFSFEKRTTHGLTFLLNYTYSKSLDDLPFGEGVSGFDTGYSTLPISDPNRHRVDYGPSAFDHTHVFVGSYVWQTPSFKNAGSLMHHLLGDYELSGIVTASSGRPFTVLQGTEISGTGIGNDRGTLCTGKGGAGDPCVVTNPYSSASCGVTAGCVSWLNPNAFEPTKVTGASCPAGQASPCNNPLIFGNFGNINKNGFRLPRTSNWDVQLSKYINFTERLKMQLRAEYFNVLNHPNFAPESANGTDQISAFDKLNGNSAFGTFRSGQAADPRVAQLAAKFIF
jgi:hypothetical protein